MNSGSNSVKKQPKKSTKPKGPGKKKPAKASKKKEDQKPTASQAVIMMQLVSKVGVRLFRTPSNEAYAVLPVKGHNEIFKLSSQPFRQYISRLMYMETKKVPQSQAVGEAVNALIGKALFDTEQTQEVYVRIARVDDTVYVDLANDDWQVVEIDADGWRIKNRSPVMFVRYKTLLPMAVPRRGGSLGDIRDLVNCGIGEDFLLMCAWIVGAFNPTGPFPILCIHGEQGSGKSTTCETLRSLIDPSVTPHRSLPQKERDLWISAKWSHVLSFDNISTIPDSMSDSLCRISTGGGYGVRTHYENDEEQVFNSVRPILLNGIPSAAVKSDLVDRCIILNLPTIGADKRITESERSERSERSFPKIMGAIFDAVSRALKNWNSVDTKTLSRMADFEQWAIAAELPAIECCDFRTAYENNRKDINSTVLESSPVSSAVRSLIHQESKFHGTATQLMAALKSGWNSTDNPLPGWLKVPQTLSNELKRIAPNLGKDGIEVIFDVSRDDANCKQLSISKVSGKDR